MRIDLHIGPETAGAARIQQVLADKRGRLSDLGILYPSSPGKHNHTRLFLAATDPDHVDPLRFHRGYADPAKQRALRQSLFEELSREVEQARPKRLILSAAQLGTSIHRRTELERLRDFLRPLSSDIRILFLADHQSRALLRHYQWQLGEGRATPLERDLALLAHPEWWQACLSESPEPDLTAGRFEETEAAPFWLDYPALRDRWHAVFGAGALRFAAYAPEHLYSEAAPDYLAEVFEIADRFGKARPAPRPQPMSAPTMARIRSFNYILQKYVKKQQITVSRQLLHKLHSEISLSGRVLPASDLAIMSDRFAPLNATLSESNAGLAEALRAPDPDGREYAEAAPERGFRASQYLLAFLYRIEKAGKPFETSDDTGQPEPDGNRPHAETGPATLSEAARTVMPPLAVQKFETLRNSSFAPHNRIGAVDEEQMAAAFEQAPPRELPEGRSGNVIVGCMKNEAPYIVEWVAYHRAIGVDNFLIYTNDCTDGTAEILDRLQSLGVVHHRNNDHWKGNSPQQYALNQALKEPVIRNADWIIHIDVDEFINVRTGNGTLQDFFDLVPDATNVAMTWRLFGHNGITSLSDAFVIDQFDHCAPKYCPKPHTVWGFKTMFRNIGAYEKISCHRPNKLTDAQRGKVRWVNGSGHDMTDEAAERGWRNSKKSIGYDLIQLNHYALRSAESYLIKRQRGRALHVDRSIGLNYWIRMDWCDHRDVTIKRNLPRLHAEYDRLMQDEVLRQLQHRGLDWHRAKAEELHQMPEFEDLYRQALRIKLTGTERVAYALALDMES